jgi:hypothetical protein
MKTTPTVTPDESSATPWGAILGGAGGVLGAITNWYAVGEQRKENAKTRQLQQQQFDKQLGWEQQQYAGTMAFNREQLATQTGLTKTQMAEQKRQAKYGEKMSNRQLSMAREAQTANLGLSNRQMALQEKQVDQQAQANKFNQIATLVGNMTQFFSNPQVRSQYASLYGRRR